MDEQSWQIFQQQFNPAKKYILAVSGGVDSVVMLDMMSRVSNLSLEIAHFNHGIRPNTSQRDADFVKKLAADYQLPFYGGWSAVGELASEDQARQARYRFLRSLKQTHSNSVICVAHHRDDIVETIALNLVRGTGWRGLAVMGASDVFRPMLNFTKQQLIDYAKSYNLSWYEDETNKSGRYLRNRLRAKINDRISSDASELLIELYQRQSQLRLAIEAETQRLITLIHHEEQGFSRYFVIMIDETSARDLLRAIFMREIGISLTRPQLDRAVWAIKTAWPSTSAQLGYGIRLNFTRQYWTISKTN
ncbi:MAG: tRNA lysidine(34) synthetase TilS [Candidatus Saccharibacteria bacterium]|nr:tRNA lysidine(34) synthetase TilS [Candidatus Saccharibacteria bacterium]